VESLTIKTRATEGAFCIEIPIDKKGLIEEIINNFRIHSKHVLHKTKRISCICDLCSKYCNLSYYCSECDFDLCIKCYDYTKGKKVNER
jgi:hypothetical protein